MTSEHADPFAHRPRRAWRRLSVELPAELSDAAADLLLEITGAGVETIAVPAPAAGGPRERLLAYVEEGAQAAENEERVRCALAALAARAGLGGAVEVRGEPLLEEDWGAGWKQHFKPFRVAPRLVVKPSWEPYAAAAGEAVIEMDPGMAFGTGLHASTRLALGLIEEVCAAAAPPRMLDIGTGTGILAMAAAMRGAARVLAIDNDPDAVAAARHNVERNRLAGRVRAAGDDLDAVGGSFELIAANITADVLEALAARIVAHLAPGGALVLSGILAGEQARQVRARYEGLGLGEVVERVEGEWAALLLRAPVPA